MTPLGSLRSKVLAWLIRLPVSLELDSESMTLWLLPKGYSAGKHSSTSSTGCVNKGARLRALVAAQTHSRQLISKVNSVLPQA